MHLDIISLKEDFDKLLQQALGSHGQVSKQVILANRLLNGLHHWVQYGLVEGLKGVFDARVLGIENYLRD